jgi:NAD(P)-dependent dehydrogenase (short-subunit alcohol dehydrogenase family)
MTLSAPVALVTGGGRRIGRTICLTLAEAGYDVAVHHRGAPDDAREVVARIQSLGRKAAAVAADLADETALAGLIPQATEALGPVTLLVNCASLFEDDRVGDLSRERWDAHLQTNLRAPVVLAEALAASLPAEIPDGAASVVNILDQRVFKPNPQFFSYTLSKSALLTATRMLAQALAPRIRVNGVGPGPTLASIHQDAEEFAREAANVPLGRGSTPEEIAETVLYLARARAVTGQMIAVDAGQHLAWRTPDIVND